MRPVALHIPKWNAVVLFIAQSRVVKCPRSYLKSIVALHNLENKEVGAASLPLSCANSGFSLNSSMPWWSKTLDVLEFLVDIQNGKYIFVVVNDGCYV